MTPLRQALVAAAIAVALVAAVPVGAQNANAPDPSPEKATLYASSNAAADRAVGWLSTDAAPGSTATVGEAIPQDCLLPITGLPPPLCTPQGIDWTWTYTLAPALRDPVSLKAGTITMKAYLGAGTGSGSGLAVSSQLKAGTTVLAEGAVQDFAFEASATGTDYGTVTWNVNVAASTLPAGSKLTWTVHVVADAGEVEGNLFMGVGTTRGHSAVQLPVAPAAPTALPGGAVSLKSTYSASTNKTVRYAWTGPGTPVAVTHAVAGKGNVTFVVKDAANATVLNATLKDVGNTTKTGSGKAGPWTIELRLSRFNGTLYLAIKDAAGGAGPGSSGSNPGTATGSSSKTTSGKGNGGNGTGNETDDGKKGAPGLPMPILAVGLVAAAAVVVARRRLSP